MCQTKSSRRTKFINEIPSQDEFKWFLLEDKIHVFEDSLVLHSPVDSQLECIIPDSILLYCSIDLNKANFKT